MTELTDSAAEYLNLSGAALVVTGASAGIGRAVAIQASRQGARVALVAREPGRLSRVRSELSGTGHLEVPFDLANLAEIPDMVRRVSQQLGPLDGLVHAAGLHAATPLKTVRVDQIDQIMSVNVSAAMMLAKGFRVRAVHSDKSSIVFISSAVGLVGQSGVSAYSASKGAIVALTKSLSLELVRDKIRVNCVAPGVVATPMTQKLRESIGEAGFAAVEAAHPLGVGSADDVANAALFLLSDSAASWITGSTLSVDGGYTAQ